VKFIKEIAGRIFALWALLLFVSTMLVAILFYLPCFLLGEPAKANWHRTVSRIWMHIFLTLSGCPLRVRGKEHFIKGRNYVVVCNHNSLLDVPVSTPFMPQANKTIAKKSFAKVPLFGWIYGFGSVLVDRKSDASRRKSYDDMRKVLAIGLYMLIYPEGTRNKTGKPLKEFYDGAFRLAVDAKKDIVPVLIFNTRKILPAGKVFYMMPQMIEMHILPAISSEHISAKELKAKVFQVMWDYYESYA
jgi:1-acyl-sn-glycerol-3-phosphate acyltransferase